jgi:hypothetical protein
MGNLNLARVRKLSACLALGLALVLIAAPALADFASGQAAYERGDFREAREQWQALAEAGDAEAQAALGSLYIQGEGVSVDYGEALRWTRLAAEQGDVTGQFNMGTIYAGGLGVEQDYAEAARWFHAAAAQNDAISRYNLAILYSRGLGVAQDDVEAVYMLNSAAIIAGTPEIGQPELAAEAERFALTMMMTMSREEIAEAHARSKDFERYYVGDYLKNYFGRRQGGEKAPPEP